MDHADARVDRVGRATARGVRLARLASVISRCRARTTAGDDVRQRSTSRRRSRRAGATTSPGGRRTTPRSGPRDRHRSVLPAAARTERPAGRGSVPVARHQGARHRGRSDQGCSAMNWSTLSLVVSVASWQLLRRHRRCRPADVARRPPCGPCPCVCCVAVTSNDAVLERLERRPRRRRSRRPRPCGRGWRPCTACAAPERQRVGLAEDDRDVGMRLQQVLRQLEAFVLRPHLAPLLRRRP